MTINYPNVNSLQAMEKIVQELSRFLDGWGDFNCITIEVFKKALTITIEPK